MTDHDRNVRTLVVCFVVLFLALLPLRFIEFGNSLSEVSSIKVLGEETVQQQVVLPNAEIELPN